MGRRKREFCSYFVECCLIYAKGITLIQTALERALRHWMVARFFRCQQLRSGFNAAGGGMHA